MGSLDVDRKLDRAVKDYIRTDRKLQIPTLSQPAPVQAWGSKISDGILVLNQLLQTWVHRPFALLCAHEGTTIHLHSDVVLTQRNPFPRCLRIHSGDGPVGDDHRQEDEGEERVEQRRHHMPYGPEIKTQTHQQAGQSRGTPREQTIDGLELATFPFLKELLFLNALISRFYQSILPSPARQIQFEVKHSGPCHFHPPP